jgi:hypothetical protein
MLPESWGVLEILLGLVVLIGIPVGLMFLLS